jgi:trans-aconitate 2-methyltransferase
MTNDFWNPTQYERFRAERARPFEDLCALIERRPIDTAVDLGCGTGELTVELHARLRPRHTIAVDRSAAMLARARTAAVPGVDVVEGDIATWAPAKPVDLLFSHAALQWVPDHEGLLPRLLGFVGANGQVAIQVPANFAHPSHTLAREAAAAVAPEQSLSQLPSVLPAERYAQILHAHGFVDVRVRVETYLHPMPSGLDVVEWTRGTLLTFYERLFPPAVFARFLGEYRARIAAALGAGAYLFTFNRLLLAGRRPPG